MTAVGTYIRLLVRDYQISTHTVLLKGDQASGNSKSTFCIQSSQFTQTDLGVRWLSICWGSEGAQVLDIEFAENPHHIGAAVVRVSADKVAPQAHGRDRVASM
ncbi:unnamed protein product [Protopolystoma xenopodis]|uniref:Uncharacterized protein n=1 Tax=Protopolystoma xenopodis TaxID=117903 RepID=A0A3S5CT71_9PLAT|nr:unnamed protein product [Protopolystoma xenopodis]